MRGWRASSSFVLAVLWLVALPGAAAAKPITYTQVERFEETFADEPFLCESELYEVSVIGRTLVHVTIETDDSGNVVPPLHLRDVVWGSVVAVPLDGTGASYVGRFMTSDSENIRSVRHGSLLAETDTDINHVIAWASDGTRISLQEHHHFTFNANGDVTIEFEKVGAICGHPSA